MASLLKGDTDAAPPPPPPARTSTNSILKAVIITATAILLAVSVVAWHYHQSLPITDAQHADLKVQWPES
ncbi:MAG: hypothetical protein HQL95_07015 [Magnetococcales bacterium]|nr:hypothetical protein [Magnetococcales bacterium]